jgi:RNA polymerase sigma-70 factor (ECF subfamily)
MTEDVSKEGQLWAELATPLRAFVARRLPPGVEPDDVVQEVFLRVLRHLDDLRDPERLHGWLFQIARNAVRDALRARQRRDSRTDSLLFDLPASAGDAHTPATEAELAPCLTPLITRLAEPYRAAIELTSYQGLTQAEAARRAGVSVSGMKSRVQRARDQLKRMLLECCTVHVDTRGAVSDYYRRKPGACGQGERGIATHGGLQACTATRTDVVASIRADRRLHSRKAKPDFASIWRNDMSNGTDRQTIPTDHPRTSACCGGPAPAGSDACCVRDAEAKTAGRGGCGCEPTGRVGKSVCCA